MAETNPAKPAVAIAGTILRRNPAFIWRRMGNEAVLFNPDTNETYRLNQTATAIWELCDGAHGPKAIAWEIAEKFEAGEAEILQDIVELIAEGERDGYIESE